MKQLKQAVVMLSVLMLICVMMPLKAEASSYKMKETKKTVYVGAETTLKVAGSKGKVTWTSSNKNVVKVTSSGKITALKAGSAIIKAKNSGKTVSCKVTVKKQPSLKSMISNMNKTLKKSHYLTMKMYAESVSPNNLAGVVAMDTEKEVSYIDLLGTKMYSTKNRTYYYDSDNGKWYYYNSSSSTSSLDLSDSIKASKCKIVGKTTFEGKKAMKVKYTSSSATEFIYFDLCDYSIIGMTATQDGKKVIMTIDTKTKVAVPKEVYKNATYKVS